VPTKIASGTTLSTRPIRMQAFVIGKKDCVILHQCQPDEFTKGQDGGGGAMRISGCRWFCQSQGPLGPQRIGKCSKSAAAPQHPRVPVVSSNTDGHQHGSSRRPSYQSASPADHQPMPIAPRSKANGLAGDGRPQDQLLHRHLPGC